MTRASLALSLGLIAFLQPAGDSAKGSPPFSFPTVGASVSTSPLSPASTPSPPLPASLAPAPYSALGEFHVLAFFTDKGEPDHIEFANQALRFFADLATRRDFSFESTTRWDELNANKLKNIQLILWLNDFPHTSEQRKAFEDYMSHGG